MKIIRPDIGSASLIGSRPYEVALTSSVEVVRGDGEAHAYVLYFDSGGVIGPHEAGFGQLLFAVAGEAG